MGIVPAKSRCAPSGQTVATGRALYIRRVRSKYSFPFVFSPCARMGHRDTDHVTVSAPLVSTMSLTASEPPGKDAAQAWPGPGEVKRTRCWTYSTAWGTASSTSCLNFTLLCPAGTYFSNQTGLPCLRCLRGAYQPYSGATACLSCPTNHFDLSRATACNATDSSIKAPARAGLP